MKRIELNEEIMEKVSGGYNVDDLEPEDLAELQRLGGMVIEMQLLLKNNDPAYDKEKIIALFDEIKALEHRFYEKYGA